MNIASVSPRAAASTGDVTAPADDYASRGDPAIVRFAAMLANAIVPPTVEPKALALDAPSSELDVPVETESAEGETSATTIAVKDADTMTALTAEQLDVVAGGSLTDSIATLIEHAIVSGAKAILKEVTRAFSGPV